MTSLPLPDEPVAPPSGAITCDPVEKYAVFVDKEAADKFAIANPQWAVNWCVESIPAPDLVQVV